MGKRLCSRDGISIKAVWVRRIEISEVDSFDETRKRSIYEDSIEERK
jgi:hypothetical protein